MKKSELLKAIARMQKEIRKMRKEFGLDEGDLLLAVNRRKISER
jgi:hypothetical protein